LILVAIFLISWGDPSEQFVLHDAINYAQSMRCIIVAAMGNGGSGYDDHHIYPAEYRNNWIIATGSYGPNGIKCIRYDDLGGNCPTSSNYGYPMDILAPGDSIPVASLNSSYDLSFGSTSAATARASGTIALVLTRINGLWSEDIDWIIGKTAQDAGPIGYDSENGWGRLNAGNIFRDILNPRIYQGKINRYADYYHGAELREIPCGPTQFYNESTLDPSRQYEVQLYEATYHINFANHYSSILGAWGNRFGIYYGFLEEGDLWFEENPNLTSGYCIVVPGTETLEGCDLRGYFYRILVNNQWLWYPTNPDNDVLLCYSVWGITDDEPNRRGEGKRAIEESIIKKENCYPNPSNSSFNIELILKDPYKLDIYL
jgi:hypothetical protein